MKVVILENIRSAYNVGNIIRTADGLGRNVWLSGYTASPDEEKKIIKTSLGAEKNVGLKSFYNPKDAIDYAKTLNLSVISAEVTNYSISLNDFKKDNTKNGFAVIFGNEVKGVLPETLEQMDQIVHIPMKGIKGSFNVGQSSAIFMRELNKLQVD